MDVNEKMGVYTELIKYIPLLENDGLGKWIVDHESEGSEEHPIQFPFVNYTRLIDSFINDVYSFCDAHPEYQHTKYGEILENHSVQWEMNSMAEVDVSYGDAKFIIALLIGAIRAERFCDGALLEFLENGSIIHWLKRLKEIDEAPKNVFCSVKFGRKSGKIVETLEAEDEQLLLNYYMKALTKTRDAIIFCKSTGGVVYYIEGSEKGPQIQETGISFIDDFCPGLLAAVNAPD